MTTSGLRPESSPQETSGDFRPGGPGHVFAAGDRDHLRDPVPPTYGGSSHSSAITRGMLAPATAARTVASRPSSSPRSSWAWCGDRRCLAQADHVLEHLAQRARVLLQDLRLTAQPGRHLEHVLVGDRADSADRLGDDQIGGELGEQLLVQFVQRLSLRHPRLHCPVDLSSVEAAWQHRLGQVGKRTCLGRVVALMGDRDDAVAEAERVEHLGRRWNEACDPHPTSNISVINGSAGRMAILPTPNGRRRPPARSTGPNSR